MDYKALGLRIRAFRKVRRLTQVQLAEAIGSTVSFVGHIENGTEQVSVETLIKVANCFHVGTDALLFDSLARLRLSGELEPFEIEFAVKAVDLMRAYQEQATGR